MFRKLCNSLGTSETHIMIKVSLVKGEGCRRCCPYLSPIVLVQFQQCPNLWIGPLRVAIALLLVTVPLSASAQTTQSENLGQVISRLRTCVRTYAPAAQAAGVQMTGDAFKFFTDKCDPPLSDLAPTDVGAVPPGIFRLAISEEWVAFVGEKRSH